MTRIRSLLAVFLFGLAVMATACSSKPDWIRPREGTYPGETADRPPGTCQRRTSDGALVTIPCSEMRVTLRTGVVGASATAKPAEAVDPRKEEGRCYIHMGDGTNRPILCQHAGTAWRWFKDEDSDEGRAERKKSWAQ